MLTKFFKRGGTDDDRRTLGGSAVKHYLLGSDDQPREKARLLLGDPDEVTEIINGLPFAKVYSSGCLSFHEKDLLTDAQKFEIIEDFEAMMFVGLQPISIRRTGWSIPIKVGSSLTLSFPMLS